MRRLRHGFRRQRDGKGRGRPYRLPAARWRAGPINLDWRGWAARPAQVRNAWFGANPGTVRLPEPLRRRERRRQLAPFSAGACAASSISKIHARVQGNRRERRRGGGRAAASGRTSLSAGSRIFSGRAKFYAQRFQTSSE